MVFLREVTVGMRKHRGTKVAMPDFVGAMLIWFTHIGIERMPEREYQFASPRKWRFDLAWPAQKVAVEVEGGTWANGRHVRGGGYERDCEKYNAAVMLGWRVLRFTTGMLRDDPMGAYQRVKLLLDSDCKRE